MGKTFEAIEGRIGEFISAQKMMFVATAPNAADGHVNLSPKGLDTFRILDARTVAYLDFVGSGAETIAHVRENGRIVLCFCAFEGPPNIVRLHGTGDVLEPGDGEFGTLRARFPDVVVEASVRAILRVRVTRISDSCGYGVPLYEYRGDRKQLEEWSSNKGQAGLEDYRRAKNAMSLDGLPALRRI